jgi:hypothetical protein
MRPEERDAALLWDMLRFARETATFVEDRTWEEYQRDGLLRRAVGGAAFQGCPPHALTAVIFTLSDRGTTP